MPRLSPKVTLISAFTAALLSSVNHAHALEGIELLEKLISQSPVDRKISWASVTEQTQDSFTLEHVEFSIFQNEPGIIGSLVVQGLREGSDGQVEFDNVTASKLVAVSNSAEQVKIRSIQSSKLSLPAILLTWTFPEEVQNSRISFEGFSINNVEVINRSGGYKIDSLKVANADVPLRYGFFETDSPDADVTPPLLIGALDLNNFSGAGDGVEFSLGSISIANAAIPTSLSAPQSDWMKMYSSVSINSIAAAFGGTEIFSLASLSANLGEPDTEGTTSVSSIMEGMIVNLKGIPDPSIQQIAAQLGYDKVEAAMTASSSINPSTGRMAVDDMTLKFKDMADLSMSYGITGFTDDVAKVVNRAQIETTMGKSPMEAYGPHFPTLSKVLLEGFKMKLTDHSLTGKLLDFQGAQMGSTGDQLAQGAPMMLGMGMAGLQMPEFTEMVTKAIGAFLQNKGSFTVETQMDQPVSIVETVMAGQVNPQSIPSLLKLQISGE